MNQTISGLLGAVLLAALSAAPARAQEVKASDLVRTQAWSRSIPGEPKMKGPPNKAAVRPV
jgi:periplasmic copper chaperone A